MNLILMALAPFSMMVMSAFSKLSEIFTLLIKLVQLGLYVSAAMFIYSGNLQRIIQRIMEMLP